MPARKPTTAKSAKNGVYRGRPKVLQKGQIDFPTGPVKFTLINIGDAFQIDVPPGWTLNGVAQSTLKSGDRTKVTLTCSTVIKRRSKSEPTTPDPLSLDVVGSDKHKIVVTPTVSPDECTITLPGLWHVRSVTVTPAKSKIVVATTGVVAPAPPSSRSKRASVADPVSTAAE